MILDNKNQKSIMKMLTLLIILFVGFQNMNVVVGAAEKLWRVCLPVTLGFSIAFVLNVLMSYLEDVPFRKMKKSKKKPIRGLVRPLSLVLTLLITAGLIVLVALVVLPRLRDTIKLITDNLQTYADNLIVWAEPILTRFHASPEFIRNLNEDVGDITKTLLQYLQSESSFLAGVAVNVTTSVMDVAANLVLGICIAIYVLLAKDKLASVTTRMCDAFLSEKMNKRVRNIASLSYGTFARFVRGQCVEAVILGTLCYLGMLLFRFPHAAVVSLLTGATALIPIAGAWIGGGVGAFLILLVDPTKALWFIVFVIILQQLEGNLIYPRVVGNSIGLPGLVVLSAVIISGNLGGIVGMLIGVPVTSILYELLKRAVAEAGRARSAREAD